MRTYGIEIIAESEEGYGWEGSRPLNFTLSLETDDYEEARVHGISLSNWNIECRMIDLITQRTVKYFNPYRNLFA